MEVFTTHRQLHLKARLFPILPNSYKKTPSMGPISSRPVRPEPERPPTPEAPSGNDSASNKGSGNSSDNEKYIYLRAPEGPPKPGDEHRQNIIKWHDDIAGGSYCHVSPLAKFSRIDPLKKPLTHIWHTVRPADPPAAKGSVDESNRSPNDKVVDRAAMEVTKEWRSIHGVNEPVQEVFGVVPGQASHLVKKLPSIQPEVYESAAAMNKEVAGDKEEVAHDRTYEPGAQKMARRRAEVTIQRANNPTPEKRTTGSRVSFVPDGYMRPSRGRMPRRDKG